MPCRSGCPTQDHQSWGECARASRLQVAGVEAHQYNTNLNRQLDDYAVARRAGLQPETWRAADVNAAYRATDSLGIPYRADQTENMTQAALAKLGVD